MGRISLHIDLYSGALQFLKKDHYSLFTSKTEVIILILAAIGWNLLWDCGWGRYFVVFLLSKLTIVFKFLVYGSYSAWILM